MFPATMLPVLLSFSPAARAADPSVAYDAGAAAPGVAALSDGVMRTAASGQGGGGKSKSGDQKDGKKGKKGGKREKEPGRKIAAAEFSNSARTLKKGTLVLSPLLQPSSYGISNKVQLLVPVLPQVLGPQVAVRYDFMNQKKADLAVEPFASSDWTFSSVTAGANLRYTIQLDGGNRLNLAGGAGFSTTLDTVQSAAQGGTSGLSADDIPDSGLTSTNVEIGYDFVADDKTVWRFLASTDPYLDALGATSAVVAANWNHSFNESFRLGLGLGVYVGGSQAVTILNKAGLDLTARNVMPLPTVELWWRL